MRTVLAASALTLCAIVSTAQAADAPSLTFGLRLQGWYVADARMTYLQGGYLLPWKLGAGRLQLYARAERLLLEDADDTSLPAAGLSYLVRGQDLKLTADWSRCPRAAQPSSSALTLQAQVGF